MLLFDLDPNKSSTFKNLNDFVVYAQLVEGGIQFLWCHDSILSVE
jgi:hypothetical protein